MLKKIYFYFSLIYNPENYKDFGFNYSINKPIRVEELELIVKNLMN